LKPIAELQEGTQIIGAGNLDHKVGTAAKDEIGQLSRAFDQMTQKLKRTTVSRDELAVEVTNRKRAEEALRKAHDELEQRVEERTAELMIANRRLRREIRERTRAEEALKQSEKELRLLSFQLLTAQE
ncbi:MAG: HAMP domain-containing protein, partial [candidate division Zixibacteria bacterium]|nr:HAMP domain-containing protein [candidate division Zixibacteria bacterium]NIX57861.1 HAMP domain-containing protein [candidate division Zixibacteria bacterium]